MKNWKELEAKLEADRELVRCKKEFAKLCKHLPGLHEGEAFFGLLMAYFKPDTLLFDWQSGADAITNDPALAKQLGYRSEKELNKKAQLARPVSELREELKQKDEARKESWKKKPPATLTRKAFIDASPTQAREWADKWGFQVLNEHWTQLEAENV